MSRRKKTCGNVEPASPDEHGDKEVAEDEVDAGENVHGDKAEDADARGAIGEELLEIMDGNVVDDVDNWVACSRRIVPRGQFLTFQHRDVRFFCSLESAFCHLVEKRYHG